MTPRTRLALQTCATSRKKGTSRLVHPSLTEDLFTAGDIQWPSCEIHPGLMSIIIIIISGIVNWPFV